MPQESRGGQKRHMQKSYAPNVTQRSWSSFKNMIAARDIIFIIALIASCYGMVLGVMAYTYKHENEKFYKYGGLAGCIIAIAGLITAVGAAYIKI